MEEVKKHEERPQLDGTAAVMTGVAVSLCEIVIALVDGAAAAVSWNWLAVPLGYPRVAFAVAAVVCIRIAAGAHRATFDSIIKPGPLAAWAIAHFVLIPFGMIGAAAVLAWMLP